MSVGHSHSTLEVNVTCNAVLIWGWYESATTNVVSDILDVLRQIPGSVGEVQPLHDDKLYKAVQG